MKRIEEFPVSEEIIREFEKINSKQWEKKARENGCIILNFSMVRMQLGWITPKLLFAKGLQEKTNCEVYVVTWRQNEELTRLFESYGFKHLVLDTLMKKDIGAICRAFLLTAKLALKGGTGEDLRRITIDGVTVGKSVYEDVLRTSALSTINSLNEKIILKKIFHIMATYYSLEKFLKKNNIQYAINDDMAYHEGLFIKLYKACGAKEIFQTNNWRVRVMKIEENGNIQTESSYLREIIDTILPEIDSNIAYDWTAKYLADRFKGKNGRALDRVAYANKQVLTRQEVLQKLGIKEDKKNIVIMAHTFTDAVFNYGDYYFRDYYDWLEKTLEISSSVENVNWILKPHPARHAYNESTDSIETMFKRISNGKTNMYFLGDDVSSESIIDVADVIVTIGSNAGAEYACFGIPSVLVGKPYYAGYGYTYEPKTLEEYTAILSDINDIDKLSEGQTRMARKVFYVRNNKEFGRRFSYYDDDFSRFDNERYEKMLGEIASSYFASNDGTKTYNDAITKDIGDYFSLHNMKECEYYKYGHNLAKFE